MSTDAENPPSPATATRTESAADGIARPVVGIGASAGGVHALKTFFEQIPGDTGMAFVVILHLSPDYESNLAAILAQTTDLTVQQAEDEMRLSAGNVYVIPPARSLTVEAGTLHLADTPATHNVSTVDRFFRSLASDQMSNAVGIVLSGTGSDGTLGLRDLKEQGGVTMVQDPSEAGYDSMPRNAVASGLIDLVLPVEDLAAKLVEYRDAAGIIQLPDRLEALDEEGKTTLQKILTLLYTETGHDFTNYKRSTVLRRLERRLQLHGISSLEAYLEFFRTDDEEIKALYKDLLISVTSYFRDQEAFEALEEEVIPQLFEGKTEGDQVRVWVPGCATGEEAYSIAMLLSEYANGMEHSPDLQIFATDVDKDALSVGRKALYPEAIQTDLSSERLRRYFKREGDYFRVVAPLREAVLFATHNVLSDPPFSDLDLVSCRNLLIYLNREMQEHVFELIHYGLNDAGYLLLGRSEAAGRASDLFSPVDTSNNILQARTLSDQKRERVPIAADRAGSADVSKFGPSTTNLETGSQSDDRPDSVERLHQRILMESVASVLVNENYEIVRLSEGATRYLNYEGGAPSHLLLNCVPDSLRAELRSAVFQALENGKSVSRRGLFTSVHDESTPVDLFVEPVESNHSQRFAHVRFEEAAEEAADRVPEDRDTHETDLEEELDRTREQLQTTNEEYEAAIEEMEAANEELLSMNEELQLKNEELETSKEELQSVTEELRTTNQKLKTKIEEVRETNSALENLMAATEIVTLFLDTDLRIQRFTPRATELFNIKPVDVGRPLADLTQRFEYKNLLEDARSVLAHVKPIEREIQQGNDRYYLARFRPYRTVQDTVGGVVLTFVDVTSRRKLEKEIVNTSEKVRRQIGQDMHDILSSDLAALTMKIGNLKDRLENKGIEEAEELEALAEMARQAANETRTMSHALVPVALQEEHLAAALENLCREQDDLSDLQIRFDGARDEDLPRNKQTATHMYRIAHEAITNADRHADANTVTVRLQREDGALVLTVRDDGGGISPNVDQSEGLGLRTMKYRSNLIGASLSVKPDQDGGTLVRCALPLDQATEE